MPAVREVSSGAAGAKVCFWKVQRLFGRTESLKKRARSNAEANKRKTGSTRRRSFAVRCSSSR